MRVNEESDAEKLEARYMAARQFRRMDEKCKHLDKASCVSKHTLLRSPSCAGHPSFSMPLTSLCSGLPCLMSPGHVSTQTSVRPR